MSTTSHRWYMPSMPIFLSQYSSTAQHKVSFHRLGSRRMKAEENRRRIALPDYIILHETSRAYDENLRTVVMLYVPSNERVGSIYHLVYKAHRAFLIRRRRPHMHIVTVHGQHNPCNCKRRREAAWAYFPCVFPIPATDHRLGFLYSQFQEGVQTLEDLSRESVQMVRVQTPGWGNQRQGASVGTHLRRQ